VSARTADAASFGRPHPFFVACLFAAGSLGVACGGRFAVRLAGTTPAPAALTFACAVDQAKAMEFEVASVDERDRRLVAERVDRSVRLADVTFRRAYDRLVVEVAPDAGGGARLDVRALTFHEFATRRGYTAREVTASEKVRAAARALVERCAAPTGAGR
jgi:hypothetical protein